MKRDEAALRKRTQIAKANRTMFIWIAVASALVGTALVVSVFLFQKLTYNEKVLAEKQNTVSTLDHNNSVIEKLREDVRLLDANQQLLSVRANDQDSALRVILDALPSDANSLALGASLQNKLLAGLDPFTLETLQVTPVVGVETLDGGSDTGTTETTTTSTTSDEDAPENIITFQFSANGNEGSIKAALQKLEKSIRTIDVTSLTLEGQGSTIIATVSARAYYEPTKTIELKDKAVPR